MAPIRTDAPKTAAAETPALGGTARATAHDPANGRPKMARGHVNAAPEGNERVRNSRQIDPSVPPGGEALDAADIERLTPVVLGLNADQIKLPSSLIITRAEAESLLAGFVSSKSTSKPRIENDGADDYLVLINGKGETALRVKLASEATPPKPTSAIVRIGNIARTAPPDRPLLGLKIAIDPGHFGGEEDLIEGKFVSAKPPGTVPSDVVCEGTIAGQSARQLMAMLTELGAVVTITRQGDVSRVHNREQVGAYLDAHPDIDKLVANRGKFLTSLDLLRRAERLSHANADIVLTLHFDAEVNWVQNDARREVKAYVPGCFVPEEDFGSRRQLQRFCAAIQNPSWHASTSLADAIVSSVCTATGAQPQLPSQTGAVNPKYLEFIAGKPGVMGRNLAQPLAIASGPVETDNGGPLSAYVEGQMYNLPDVWAKALRDMKTRDGAPDGFVIGYARSLRDGIVNFVRSQA